MNRSRRTQVVGPGEIRVVSSAAPEVRPATDLLCRVRAVGVCGTDVSLVRSGDVLDGQVLGHEIVAEVIDAPPGSPTPSGTRVMVRPIRGCDRCWYCRSGMPHQCDSSAELTVSYGRPGAYADLLVLDAPEQGEVVAVADTIDDLDAVWAEPLAVALHGVGLATAPDAGQLVVVGAGPLGLCAAAAGVAQGLDVISVEPRAARREAATAIGVSRVVDPATERVPACRQVLTTVGSGTALEAAHAAVLPGGVVVHAGLGHGALLPSVTGPVTTIGSFGYLPEEFVRSTELINGGDVRLGRLVTHQFGLDDIAVAMTIASKDPDAVKVVVRP